MTHFTVGIIVPQDKLPQIQTFIYHQMEPYDESDTVDPYVCYSLDMAQTEIERDLCRLERIVDRQDPNYRLDKCRESLARLRLTTPEDRYREYAQTHEHFSAQGEPLTTYNPDSKWDWWVVGGRWNGWITGNKSDSRDLVEDNLAPVEQAIQRGVIPHAIITPDGQWHEHGKLGWWAILLTEDEDWNAQATEILSGYGPINKTTFGETADGSVIRRMPNLVKFKEDPDAMLVMSLEDYDEVTGKAIKAAIMSRDVVGRNPPITQVNSAEEGLLVSLNQRGTVDLPYIASLYGKPEVQIIEELGELIFHDPESKQWQTADAYLSLISPAMPARNSPPPNLGDWNTLAT